MLHRKRVSFNTFMYFGSKYVNNQRLFWFYLFPFHDSRLYWETSIEQHSNITLYFSENEGWENPFQPEGAVSHDADLILRLWKGGNLSQDLDSAISQLQEQEAEAERLARLHQEAEEKRRRLEAEAAAAAAAAASVTSQQEKSSAASSHNGNNGVPASNRFVLYLNVFE